MIKNLVKNGSSWSLLIEKPVMDMLGLSPGGLVHLRIVDQQMIIRSADNSEQAVPRKLPSMLSMDTVIHRLNYEGFGPEAAKRLNYRASWGLLIAHAAADRLAEPHNNVLRALLARRQAQPKIMRGESWEDSIDAVIAEHGDLSDALGNHAA